MAEGDPPPTTTTPPPAGGADKTFTQAELDRIVGERLARERQQYADYEQLKEKAGQFDQLSEEQKSDLERTTGERDKFKTDAEKTAAENLRLRVALDKKLPTELIDRLQGATKEELAADADQLLELVQPTPGFDGGARREVPAPKDMDAAIRAAAGRTA